ncbi:hypothetical protein PR003_g16939 [Phytophthora rubi]|uniref:RanBP2-type domain-containing protein n=1 Tax=Phytophthora rubi TaxID=129364 RepID=A0A6A4ECH3_9STRA|nr:hypothetical protein PR002_g16545 [Phytophthora rubi]KAE9010124.1 hypothetical protein PR001_g16264 [Phytophthora rubi]KAE9323615.1 hypothetical protein PR003_g16939 [Phytophthora rubi]
MARTRQQEVVQDWSCPLCTLLNSADDDRCQACDNARPPAHLLEKSQPPDVPTAAATGSEVQRMYRPVSGVFFSASVRAQGDSSSAAAWRQEPRLVVNRRRGSWRRAEAVERESEQISRRSETGTAEQTTDSTATERGLQQEIKSADEVQKSEDAVEPMVTTEVQEEEEEEEETAMEPCFNLLGSGASVFAAAVVEDAVEGQCAIEEKESREEGVEADGDDDVVSIPSAPKYPGFMPASKVRIEEPLIEDKLASAGLDLSDSDNDEEEPKLLRRDKHEVTDHSWEDKWVCQICTNLNDQSAMECASCTCKRYKDAPSILDTATGSDLKWACHICTNLNPPELTECDACYTDRRRNAPISNGSADEKWRCNVCTTFNAPGTTRCEVCDRTREDERKQPAGKDVECPVCTNTNPPGSKQCTICETSLQPDDTPDDHFVDLASSPPARKHSYSIDDGDLNNPYADLSQYNNYDAQDEVANPDPDFVEDISDNEAMMSLNNTRPTTVRAELKEFKHFVCMEDLRNDYGCRINYSKMFAGQRSRKSYADRLATRTAASRKRQRNAARRAAGEAITPPPRGGKARGGKKRKTPAGSRRASSAGTKAPKAKKARKTAASGRRASSATTPSPIVNHYDDSGADFGDGFSTMAWEGVGSAGYH